HDDRVQPVEDPVLETRIVHRSYLHEPRVRLAESAPVVSDAEFVMTLPDVSLAPVRGALAPLLDDLERTHHGARLVSYDSGAIARLERTSALARVARVVDDGDDREALLAEAFGTKTYAAAAVGWVPSGEREVERFTLPARPPMEPEKSEHRMVKALRQADAVSAPGDEAPQPEAGDRVQQPDRPDEGRRGLFGRRR
ncbi:MAG TPA: hypothetical protein VGV65_13650, partial [Nocardioides sp.]|nr:hypothetical protein [Nocardioides sp.]